MVSSVPLELSKSLCPARVFTGGGLVFRSFYAFRVPNNHSNECANFHINWWSISNRGYRWSRPFLCSHQIVILCPASVCTVARLFRSLYAFRVPYDRSNECTKHRLHKHTSRSYTLAPSWLGFFSLFLFWGKEERSKMYTTRTIAKHIRNAYSWKNMNEMCTFVERKTSVQEMVQNAYKYTFRVHCRLTGSFP